MARGLELWARRSASWAKPVTVVIMVVIGALLIKDPEQLAHCVQCVWHLLGQIVAAIDQLVRALTS